MPGEKEKTKKDAYKKALTAYSQAMRAFRKGNVATAKESFEDFLEKHDTEKELVDRARMYLAICENRQKKKEPPLNSFEDYYQYAVFKINQEDYDKALKLLEKAREKEPKEGKAVYLMALTYCRMGKTEKCLEVLTEAAQMDSFFGVLAQNEIDFEALWEDKKFKVITKMA